MIFIIIKHRINNIVLDMRNVYTDDMKNIHFLTSKNLTYNR